MNGRIEAIQADANRRFDQVFEAWRVFEGRIARLEERVGIAPDTAEHV